ncbi:luciferin 4-monooxygenase [Amyelois transitella]|uniref:luciferin 4-monooxygenase n=1 Tax=Amyelois transitella TaxID=680683 RepID=UPI00298FD862|nr:luciferin 4-monooxygenase [Amyelois transitella]
MVDSDIVVASKSEGFHLGHLFLSIMKKSPDELNQIDAATGQKETNASVLSRSVRLAKCLRRLGLQPGDVVALSGPNHINIHIPYYAAMLNGLPLVGADRTFKYDEVYELFKRTAPKIAFCHYEMSEIFERAAKALNLTTKIVTFDKGNCTMDKFLDSYNEDGSLDGFAPASFDLEKVYLWLIGTGGTTGGFKIAAFKHRPWVEKTVQYYQMVRLLQMKLQKAVSSKQPSWAENLSLNLSPIHWVSGFFNPIAMAITGQCKLQTSAEQTAEHVIDVINEYKPTSVLMGPSLMTSILNHEKPCDFSCFTVITLTGGQVYKDILVRLKQRVREETLIFVAYAQTETLCHCLTPLPFGPLGNCGQPMANVQLRLVDPETGKDITEPNTPGELWTKGPSFTEYYNSPEETAQAFTEDGWYKTGDILYRDDNNYYFFVERLKMLIKYRNQHVLPVELEEVIRSHADVFDVGVTSIPSEQDGEHPVACVVTRPGSHVTAQQIHTLVADKLSESKQLRGGVVFLRELPLTSTGKLARAALRKLVLDCERL